MAQPPARGRWRQALPGRRRRPEGRRANDAEIASENPPSESRRKWQVTPLSRIGSPRAVGGVGFPTLRLAQGALVSRPIRPVPVVLTTVPLLQTLAKPVTQVTVARRRSHGGRPCRRPRCAGVASRDRTAPRRP